MWKSRIRAKLEKDEPALITALHFCDPSLYELVSLLGFDGIWLDLEHHAHSDETAAQLIRAARVGGTDVMTRPAKGEFMRMGRLLEAGARAIMYPRCNDAAEAAEVVRWAKFAPQGERGIDSANPDNPYLLQPLTDYLVEANRQTVIVIQLEEPSAVENVEEIAAVDGVDVLFLGPGDFSILAGVPGQFTHPLVEAARERIAKAARDAGKHWGCPCGDIETAKRVMDMGGRFICHQSDITTMKAALEKMQQDFAPLGFTFSPRFGGGESA